MTAYANNPFQTAVFLQKGVASYLFGSYNYKQGPTKMRVSNIVGDGTHATLTVQIYSGEIPIVGALVSVKQTQTSSGAFNVNRAALTGVTIASTGAGTITFLSATSVSTTPDTGEAVAEVPEIGEAIVAQASIPCCIAAPDGDSQFTVPFAVTFPTLPTAVTVGLQAALHNVDAEFTTILPTAAVVAASSQTVGPFGYVTLQRGYFYRFIVSGLTGTGLLVAKIGG